MPSPNADLGTIKGIGGMLESTGRFTGVLERIVAKGATKTPDFSLDIGGKPMRLDTVYTAIIDGTNGDTLPEAGARDSRANASDRRRWYRPHAGQERPHRRARRH